MVQQGPCTESSVRVSGCATQRPAPLSPCVCAGRITACLVALPTVRRSHVVTSTQASTAERRGHHTFSFGPAEFCRTPPFLVPCIAAPPLRLPHPLQAVSKVVVSCSPPELLIAPAPPFTANLRPPASARPRQPHPAGSARLHSCVHFPHAYRVSHEPGGRPAPHSLHT